MAVAGFYRRALPSPPAVEFSSSDGKMLFAEAFGERTMEGFFKLISYYQTQSEPAYCGLTTLAMVLNALSIDPGRKWKGPWRWFDDSMLDCCEPLAKIKAEGTTFGKVACLASCNGAKVVALRANESTIDEFREKIVICTSSQDCHIITSYNRKTFQQTGSGHFSPIGGYHSGKDMVLILDVARFKYPPHWVPLSLLWDAMNTIDEATGQLRGYMILSKLSTGPSILYTVSCQQEGWNNVIEYLTEKLPSLLKTHDVKDIEDALSVAFQSPPRDLTEFIKWVAEVRRQEDESVILSEEEKSRLEIKGNILKQLRETELFKRVRRWLESRSSFGESLRSLPEMAASVCCQGAGSLAGKFYHPDQTCCTRTDVKLLKFEGDDNPKALVSGTVVSNGAQQGVDMLLPLCNSNALVSSDECCCELMLPSMVDFLTILLLFLPRTTWSGIKEGSVLVEIDRLVSTDNLPSLLQDEVLYLQQQMHFLVSEFRATNGEMNNKIEKNL